VLPAITGTVASLTFDRERLAEASVGGFALATDLAEELVTRGVAFREAHEIVGEVVRVAEEQGVDLDGLDPERLAQIHPSLDAEMADRLTAEQAITRRDGVNATGVDQVRAQLERARAAAAANR